MHGGVQKGDANFFLYKCNFELWKCMLEFVDLDLYLVMKQRQMKMIDADYYIKVPSIGH
jgi:hypothetical protein